MAVALVVMIGVSIYISMNTAYYNLDHSRDVFYRENHFADYYFHVVRAPYQVIKRIEALSGVDMVTGRVQMDVPLMRENADRGTIRLTGYHLPLDKEVNRIQLLSGRMFDKDPSGGRIEVLTDPQFAAANRLNPGDSLVVAAQGREVTLTVTGTAGGAGVYLSDEGCSEPDAGTGELRNHYGSFEPGPTGFGLSRSG